jgi:hypothetical protein
MTIRFACPSCRKPLRAAASKIGQRGQCPKCYAAFEVPGVEPPAANEDDSCNGWGHNGASDPFTNVPPLTFTIEEASDPCAARGTSLLRRVVRGLDLVLDVRFKRYFTPYIVRILWAMFILGLASGFVWGCFIVPMGRGLVKEERSLMSDEAKLRMMGLNTGKPAAPERAEPQGAASKHASALAEWLRGAAFYALLSVVLLLITRVLAESVIVLFNIANDLKETKLRLAQRSEPD